MARAQRVERAWRRPARARRPRRPGHAVRRARRGDAPASRRRRPRTRGASRCRRARTEGWPAPARSPGRRGRGQHRARARRRRRASSSAAVRRRGQADARSAPAPRGRRRRPARRRSSPCIHAVARGRLAHHADPEGGQRVEARAPRPGSTTSPSGKRCRAGPARSRRERSSARRRARWPGRSTTGPTLSLTAAAPSPRSTCGSRPAPSAARRGRHVVRLPGGKQGGRQHLRARRGAGRGAAAAGRPHGGQDAGGGQAGRSFKRMLVSRGIDWWRHERLAYQERRRAGRGRRCSALVALGAGGALLAPGPARPQQRRGLLLAPGRLSAGRDRAPHGPGRALALVLPAAQGLALRGRRFGRGPARRCRAVLGTAAIAPHLRPGARGGAARAGAGGALLAAALVALHPLQVQQGRNARMYALGMRPGRAHGLAAAAGAARRRAAAPGSPTAPRAALFVYTHYYALFTLAAQVLGALVLWPRGRAEGEEAPAPILRPLLLAGGVALLLLLPWLPSFWARRGGCRTSTGSRPSPPPPCWPR